MKLQFKIVLVILICIVLGCNEAIESEPSEPVTTQDEVKEIEVRELVAMSLSSYAGIMFDENNCTWGIPSGFPVTAKERIYPTEKITTTTTTDGVESESSEEKEIARSGLTIFVSGSFVYVKNTTTDDEGTESTYYYRQGVTESTTEVVEADDFPSVPVVSYVTLDGDVFRIKKVCINDVLFSEIYNKVAKPTGADEDEDGYGMRRYEMITGYILTDTGIIFSRSDGKTMFYNSRNTGCNSVWDPSIIYKY